MFHQRSHADHSTVPVNVLPNAKKKAVAMATHNLAVTSNSPVTRTPLYTRNYTRHMPCSLLAYFPSLKKK
jgi:hypothetical protein